MPMCCTVDTFFLHNLWNAKQFSVVVDYSYLVCYEYTEFHISILSLLTPGIHSCALSIFWSDAPCRQTRDEITTDLMSINMKNNIFPLISTIIRPNMLTLCCPVQLETLGVVYLNLHVALARYIDKYIDVQQLFEIQHCNAGRQT